jgi:hypothetical protein
VVQEARRIEVRGNSGMVVIVTSNRMIAMVAGVVTRVSGKPLRMVNSMDEALTFLKQVDPDLP